MSAYLRQVKAGGSVVIMERGKPIGRIIPVPESTEERLEHLSQAGAIAWSEQKLAPLAPVARAAGSRNASDLLLEDRE